MHRSSFWNVRYSGYTWRQLVTMQIDHGAGDLRSVETLYLDETDEFFEDPMYHYNFIAQTNEPIDAGGNKREWREGEFFFDWIYQSKKDVNQALSRELIELFNNPGYWDMAKDWLPHEIYKQFVKSYETGKLQEYIGKPRTVFSRNMTERYRNSRAAWYTPEYFEKS